MLLDLLIKRIYLRPKPGAVAAALLGWAGLGTALFVARPGRRTCSQLSPVGIPSFVNSLHTGFVVAMQDNMENCVKNGSVLAVNKTKSKKAGAGAILRITTYQIELLAPVSRLQLGRMTGHCFVPTGLFAALS